MLRLSGQAAVAAALGAGCARPAAGNKPARSETGRVVGNPVGAQVGERVLAEGGNAVDAAITAALAVCVTSPWLSGIGGYGGHMMIALAGGKKITSIDFNSTAPIAARDDMYPLDEKGEVNGRINQHGWLAVGVPGTLAGFQSALDRYGTRPFREAVQPAIQFARDGFVVAPGLATAIRGAQAQLKNEPGSARLYLENGEPPQPGVTLRNPDLAKMLATLAGRNSVDSFYRGDIGSMIAHAIQKNGGLVSAADMSAYRAREVSPLEMRWDDFRICTAPLTAGGLSVLEALGVLRELRWPRLSTGSAALHARVETLRTVWKDRLELLGDPDHAAVPLKRLRSTAHARELAGKIEAAVKTQRPLAVDLPKNSASGTTNLSAVDREGNMVAVTFTQGGAFGAQVTVDGLGLTLGHGMSRFNPRAGHPNSPGPRKRPLNNMCPTIVLRGGRPVFAVGGAGGVKIPNTIFDILAAYVVKGGSLEEAVAAPRVHTTGMLDLTLERAWPQAEQDHLKGMGFKVSAGSGARASAVAFDPATGRCSGAER